MYCHVKNALFPFDDSSFWNDLYQFCKEYGETIEVLEMKKVALSDNIGDFNLELAEQPSYVNKGYGARLGDYTLMQEGNSWVVLKGEVVVAILNSWEDLAKNEDLDSKLACLIRQVKAKKEEQRKAFIDKVLSRQTKVDAVKRPEIIEEIQPTITQETQDEEDEEDDDYYW